VLHLQSVQTGTARLITGTRRRDHITPVLRELHWLPIRERIRRVTFLAKHEHGALLTSLQSDMQHERVRVSVNNAVVYIRHFLVNIRAVE